MRKILVVDDDRDFLFTIKRILTDNGFTVNTVESQEDIYKAILNFSPLVILLDINLKGFDGRNICRGLKNHFKTQNIPVILCSGDYKLREGFDQFMAEDFLEKPLEVKRLIERLNYFCSLPPLSIGSEK